MKKDGYISEISVGMFNLKLNGDKKSLLPRINTFKGFYGYVRAVNGKIRYFKLISAREYKKDPNKISLSILVQPRKGDVMENKWQMVRVFKDCSCGEIQFLTKSYPKLCRN